MTGTRQAVILAAGEGKRLRPMTDTMPKCLVPVAGRPLLDWTLEALGAVGCARALVVDGHLSPVLRTELGSSRHGIALEYVGNERYASTNSMFSLLLGLRLVAGPSWVVEADVCLEGRVLELPMPGEFSWLVDSSLRAVSGAYLQAAADGRVDKLEIIRDPSLLRDSQLKSVGVLHLTETVVPRVRRWLEDGVEKGQHNLYYDLVVAEHFAEADVRVVDVRGLRWYEVDTPEDLKVAGALFS